MPDEQTYCSGAMICLKEFVKPWVRKTMFGYRNVSNRGDATVFQYPHRAREFAKRYFSGFDYDIYEIYTTDRVKLTVSVRTSVECHPIRLDVQ